MPVSLSMGFHVPQAITEQLRRRGFDVLTAQEDRSAELSDENLLLRAMQLQRVVFTHDLRFHALAVTWQREGRVFAGLLYGDQTGVGIGAYVRDLELIAVASESSEWTSSVQGLAFK